MTSSQSSTSPAINEEFIAEPSAVYHQQQTILTTTAAAITIGTNILGNTRRHTVGPGDVAYEQALANPAVPINFKFGPENGPHLPINLPMLQNQPLHNFTIKNQHLLKPPTVMGASKLINYVFI